MIRQPTDLHRAFAWWRAALAGDVGPIHEGAPQPGFYRRRLVRGGPWVGVAIWLAQEIDPETGELVADERLVATVDGAPADPIAVWTYCAKNPIPEAEYRFLIAAARHAQAYEPEAPRANPRRPIDLMSAALPF